MKISNTCFGALIFFVLLSWQIYSTTGTSKTANGHACSNKICFLYKGVTLSINCGILLYKPNVVFCGDFLLWSVLHYIAYSSILRIKILNYIITKESCNTAQLSRGGIFQQYIGTKSTIHF